MISGLLSLCNYKYLSQLFANWASFEWHNFEKCVIFPTEVICNPRILHNTLGHWAYLPKHIQKHHPCYENIGRRQCIYTSHRVCQTVWRNASKHYWLMLGKHITLIRLLCLWTYRILQSTKMIKFWTTLQLWGGLFNSIPDLFSRRWPQYYITKWPLLQIDLGAICQRDLSCFTGMNIWFWIISLELPTERYQVH